MKAFQMLPKYSKGLKFSHVHRTLPQSSVEKSKVNLRQRHTSLLVIRLGHCEP